MNSEQKEYIKEHYLERPYSAIARELGISTGSVQAFVQKSKLPLKRKRTYLNLTEKDEQFIRDNYKTMTYPEIGKRLGITGKQVCGWVHNHIENVESKHRVFNDRYFQTIDTPDRAYWLGFIYADGWISIHKRSKSCENKTYEFGMELQRRDEYILHALNKALGGKHIVQQKEKRSRVLYDNVISETQSSVLRIYSRSFVEDLIANGIDVHKTYSETIPVVPDEYFMDFLRGYIDGDGCIHHMRKNHLAVHITSANKHGLEYLQQKLFDDYNIRTSIYAEDVGDFHIKYRLYCYRNDDVKALLDNIYKDPDAIKLERKYSIYLNYYGLTA